MTYLEIYKYIQRYVRFTLQEMLKDITKTYKYHLRWAHDLNYCYMIMKNKCNFFLDVLGIFFEDFNYIVCYTTNMPG